MEASIFIVAVLAGVTEFVKLVAPRVHGALTIAVAALIGVLVAVVDTHIGILDITIAEGLMSGLAAAGVVAVAKRV